jgi:hypothetical protein
MKKSIVLILCAMLFSPVAFSKEDKGFKYKDGSGKVQYCKGEVQCGDETGKHCECLADPEIYKQLKAEEKAEKEKAKAKKNKR